MNPNFELSLKINSNSPIPMYQELSDELLFLMLNPDHEKSINKWFVKTGIRIFNFDENADKFNSSSENILDVFWSIVNKITENNEKIKVNYYKNLFLNFVQHDSSELPQIKSFIEIISKLSVPHFKVLRLIDGMLDYFAYIEMTPPNTMFDTLSTLDRLIEFTIPELRGKYEKIITIWKELLELGLRKDESLYLRLTPNRLAWFSITSDIGKKFLKFASAS